MPIEPTLSVNLHQQERAFWEDVSQIVRTIAQRHRAKSDVLSWQLVRDVCEEALADLGLAARWSTETIDRLASRSPVPPFDGWISTDHAIAMCELDKPDRECVPGFPIG
jgi:hypothetical protein